MESMVNLSTVKVGSFGETKVAAQTRATSTSFQRPRRSYVLMQVGSRRRSELHALQGSHIPPETL